MRKSDAKVEVVYVSDDGTAARTVDGVGFVYYDTEQEAVDDALYVAGIEYIDELREDWEEDDYLYDQNLSNQDWDEFYSLDGDDY